MNISIFLFAVFLSGSLAAFFYRPATAYFLFPICLLAFPTVRLSLGFPLYLFDFLGVLLLVHSIRNGALRSWPANATPWHWIISALLLLAGILVPTARYGFNAPSLWITGHASVALLQILIGSNLARQNKFDLEARYLTWGIVASLAILAIIAWLQFGNPVFSGAYNAFFYRDIGRSLITSSFGAELTASRAGGPFGSANALGVVALIAGFTAWCINRQRLGVIALMLAVLVIVPTVSRQAYISTAIAAALYFLLAGPKTRLVGLLLLLAAPFMAPLIALFSAGASAIERFSRWRGGALEDSNIYARLVAGPQRLWSLIEQQPDVLLFGAGWDITKLSSQGVDTGVYATGFVSNGYLLWLYYGGVLGLLTIVGFMVSITWAAFRLKGEERARAVAIVLPIAFLYFSDNTGALVEAMISCTAIVGGFILVRASAAPRPARRRPAHRAPASRAPAWDERQGSWRPGSAPSSESI